MNMPYLTMNRCSSEGLAVTASELQMDNTCRVKYAVLTITIKFTTATCRMSMKHDEDERLQQIKIYFYD